MSKSYSKELKHILSNAGYYKWSENNIHEVWSRGEIWLYDTEQNPIIIKKGYLSQKCANSLLTSAKLSKQF